jgi:hypothetical protein
VEETVEHGQTLFNQTQVLLVLAVALAAEQHKKQNLAALELLELDTPLTLEILAELAGLRRTQTLADLRRTLGLEQGVSQSDGALCRIRRE